MVRLGQTLTLTRLAGSSSSAAAMNRPPLASSLCPNSLPPWRASVIYAHLSRALLVAFRCAHAILRNPIYTNQPQVALITTPHAQRRGHRIMNLAGNPSPKNPQEPICKTSGTTWAQNNALSAYAQTRRTRQPQVKSRRQRNSL